MVSFFLCVHYNTQHYIILSCTLVYKYKLDNIPSKNIIIVLRYVRFLFYKMILFLILIIPTLY